MKSTAIYERLPVPLQNAVIAVYGRRLHRMRFGGVHAAQREEILRCEAMTARQLRAHQIEKLRPILCEAAENVRHYRPHADLLRRLAREMQDPDEIRQLPLLEKATINADPTAFHTERPRGRPIFGHTSGTTGRPMRTMKIADSYQRNWAFYARSKEMHGVHLGMRRASFGVRIVVPLRQRRPPFWRYEPAENDMYFSMFHISEETLPAYVEQLRRWKPEEIVCLPSALTVVADWMLARGETIGGVRAVFSSGETLGDSQRERIARAFETRVVNLYGLGENVVWIYECPEGRMHIRPDYGYTELHPLPGELAAGAEEGEVREIVSTGFINPAMPLLRYRVRDQVVLTDQDQRPCECGAHAFPTVTRVIGRTDDNLVAPDGRVVPRLGMVFKDVPGVRESQIEQTALDTLLVRILPKEDWGPAVEEMIAHRLQGIFGPSMRIEVRVVDELLRTRTGKVRYQINSIGRP